MNQNPILSVDGVALSRYPSKYKWSLQDVSSSDAGRTEDVLMHKNRIGQKVKIELEFRALTTAECSQIMTVFNPEYVNVNFLDAMAGTYLTKTFYVGDRATPLWSSNKGIWESLSFSIIER